jgi:hypothetical protein
MEWWKQWLISILEIIMALFFLTQNADLQDNNHLSISQQKKPRGSFIVSETSNGNSNYHHGDAFCLDFYVNLLRKIKKHKGNHVFLVSSTTGKVKMYFTRYKTLLSNAGPKNKRLAQDPFFTRSTSIQSDKCSKHCEHG